MIKRVWYIVFHNLLIVSNFSETYQKSFKKESFFSVKLRALPLQSPISHSFLYAKQCDWICIFFHNGSLAEEVSIHHLYLVKGSKELHLSHRFAALQLVLFINGNNSSFFSQILRAIKKVKDRNALQYFKNLKGRKVAGRKCSYSGINRCDWSVSRLVFSGTICFLTYLEINSRNFLEIFFFSIIIFFSFSFLENIFFFKVWQRPSFGLSIFHICSHFFQFMVINFKIFEQLSTVLDGFFFLSSSFRL